LASRRKTRLLKRRSRTHKSVSKHPSDLIADSYKRLKAGQPVAAGHVEHEKGPFTSVRELEYNGHKITIHTQYEIRVDGKPFSGHVYVDNTGKVSTHALPNYSFDSAIDLIKKMIDEFPEGFVKKKSYQSSNTTKKRRRRRRVR
jgi:hypothetical protein